LDVPLLAKVGQKSKIALQNQLRGFGVARPREARQANKNNILVQGLGEKRPIAFHKILRAPPKPFERLKPKTPQLILSQIWLDKVCVDLVRNTPSDRRRDFCRSLVGSGGLQS
jgi:hypothetical protein